MLIVLVKHLLKTAHSFMLVFLFQLALPYSHDSPATCFKNFCDFFVMKNVTLALLIPVISIIFWTCISTIVTVPKAAVNKKSHPYI